MPSADPDLLKRLHYLALLAQRGGSGALLAATKAKLPAGGTEATGVRDYAPGDDYRQIDWAWCARRDELITKVFEGQPDLHTYILLDCSASMGVGRPTKFHVARRIAAALGYVALARLDRLGVVGFAHGLTADLPPLRHRTRLPRLLEMLAGLSLQPGETDLAAAVQGFVGRDRRRGAGAGAQRFLRPRRLRPGAGHFALSWLRAAGGADFRSRRGRAHGGRRRGTLRRRDRHGPAGDDHRADGGPLPRALGRVSRRLAAVLRPAGHSRTWQST